MNEQLQNTMNDAAASLIEKAMGGLDSATGFLQAELPEYVYQLMLWYSVKSAVLCALMMALSALWFHFGVVKPIKMITTGLKNNKTNFFVEESYRNGGVQVSGSAIPLIFSVAIILPLSVAISKGLTVLKIWIAPKVWLVEYASTLIK